MIRIDPRRPNASARYGTISSHPTSQSRARPPTPAQVASAAPRVPSPVPRATSSPSEKIFNRGGRRLGAGRERVESRRLALKERSDAVLSSDPTQASSVEKSEAGSDNFKADRFPRTLEELSRVSSVYFYTPYRSESGEAMTRRVGISGELFGALMNEGEGDPAQVAKTMIQLGERIEIKNSAPGPSSSTRDFLRQAISNWEAIQHQVDAALIQETTGMTVEERQNAYGRAVWTRVLEQAIRRVPSVEEKNGRNRAASWPRSLSPAGLEEQLVRMAVQDVKDGLPGPTVYQRVLQNVILNDSSLFQKFIEGKFSGQPAMLKLWSELAGAASSYSEFVERVGDEVGQHPGRLHGLVAAYLKAHPDVYRTYLRRVVDHVIYADYSADNSELYAASAIGQFGPEGLRQVFGHYSPRLDNGLAHLPEQTSLINQGLFWELSGYHGPWTPPGPRTPLSVAQEIVEPAKSLPRSTDAPPTPSQTSVFGKDVPQPVLYVLEGNRGALGLSAQKGWQGPITLMDTDQRFRKLIAPQHAGKSLGRHSVFQSALFKKAKRIRLFDAEGSATPYFSGPVLGRFYNTIANEIGIGSDAALQKFFESMLAMGPFLEVQMQEGATAVGAVPALFGALYGHRRIKWLRYYDVWTHQAQPMLQNRAKQKQQSMQQYVFDRLLQAEIP